MMKKKIAVDEHMGQGENLQWKCHISNLMREIIDNYPGKGGGFLRAPMQILLGMMHELGKRCAEVNDPVLNHLMCRLAIYSEADPTDKENYNPEKVKEVTERYKEYIRTKKEAV